MDQALLEQTAKALVAPGKGILAADESSGSIKKRFDGIGVESTPENHRLYRQLLFTTPGIEEFISGVIMFDETFRQLGDDNVPLPKVLADRGILPGIKVDLGTEDMPNFPDEKLTKGLDDLLQREEEYVKLGAKFAKWRAVIVVSMDNVATDAAIDANAEILARYATTSQNAGLVPIVEPEVLVEGSFSLDKSEQVTYNTLKKVFNKLSEYKVYFPGMLLKPNWVHPATKSGQEVVDRTVAEATLRVLKETVPPEVPGVVFLSGGDNPAESTLHLNTMNEMDDVPWQLSFSYGRALQEPVLAAWAGKVENVKTAQDIFYKRAKLNSLARSGKYKKEMEDGK